MERRSLQQIRQEIAVERNSRPELAFMRNPSNTAIYRLIEDVIAFAIWVHEGFWGLFRKEVEERIAAIRPGTLGWYADVVKVWQNGVALNPQTGKYDNVDTSLQIVSRVSVKELAYNDSSGKDLRIKVAKENPPTALNSVELTSLQQYIEQKKYAGVHIDLVSLEFDEIVIVEATVYYRGIGNADAVNKVISATQAYLDSLSGSANFDGVYVRNDHIARVRQEEGIVDFDIVTITGQAADAASATPIGVRYEAISGHFLLNIDDSNINPIAV